MSDILLRFATPIIFELLAMIFMSLATVAAGIFTRWLYRWTGYQADEAQAQKLEHAIQNGISAATAVLGSVITDQVQKRAAVQNLTAQYVKQFNPGALKHFKLGDEALKSRIAPHLPDRL